MEENKSFRDIIYTADEEGHRKWVFASKPSGKLYNWRSIVSYIYLIVFFTLPFIELHGEPLCSPFWSLLYSLLFYMAAYFAVGFVRKQYLWKWFFAK